MNNHETDDNQGIIGVISERLLNGILKENPTFVLLLGMCPTLAVTTSAINGLGMGVTTMVVLTLSNLIISALRKFIPSKIRIPAFIVIIASFVTIVELLLKAYIPSLYDSLGLYIPLIVVNCIILGRAESYAYSHPVVPSLFDGLGMGMGFSIALTIIGALRELLGAGTVFGKYVMPEGFVPINIFIMAPGAFFVLAMLTAIQNKVKEIGLRKGFDVSKIQSGCGGNCLECDRECKKNQNVDKAEEVPAEEVTSEEPTEEPLAEEESVTEEIEKDEIAEPLPKKEKGRKKSLKSFVKDISFKKAETLESEKTVDVEEDAPKEVTEDVAVEAVEEVFEETFESVTEDLTESVETTAVEPAIEIIPETFEEKVEEITQNEEPKPQEVSVDSDLELLDLDDYRDAIKKSQPSGKKPQRKKSSRAKAQAMLFGAEETVKEDKDND